MYNDATDDIPKQIHNINRDNIYFCLIGFDRLFNLLQNKTEDEGVDTNFTLENLDRLARLKINLRTFNSIGVYPCFVVAFLGHENYKEIRIVHYFNLKEDRIQNEAYLDICNSIDKFYSDKSLELMKIVNSTKIYFDKLGKETILNDSFESLSYLKISKFAINEAEQYFYELRKINNVNNEETDNLVKLKNLIDFIKSKDFSHLLS